jgi:DNA-binding NarL/FixJ family response regulator
MLELPQSEREVHGVTDAAAIRVVVGEDQTLVREGIVRILESAGLQVVGVAQDADELIRKAATHHPDVVVTDIRMPPEMTDDGLRAARQIRAAQPDVGVVVLSQFLEGRYALDLIGDRADGVGYLLKDRVSDLALFIDAVRRVARGGSALDPDVVRRMVGRSREKGPLDSLTPREREVLVLMAEGLSNQAIADELVVGVPAVERHVTSIFNKLGLRPSREDHRRVLAVLQYLRRQP